MSGVCVKEDVTGYLVVDSATPLETCSMVLLSGQDYTEMVGTFVASAEDAVLISAAFAGLLVTGFIFKVLRRQIEDVEIGVSEEKH